MIKNGTALLIERNIELAENKIITDESCKDKKYYIHGIFMQAEVKNRNGRVYPEKYMDREALRYIKEYIETDRAIGELNHPTGDGSLSVNYERTSHKIESLKKVGTNWEGRALITHKTPMGSIVAGLIDAGVKVGVSSRATGSLKLDGHGIKIVQEDFHLITPADIVADPSAPDAFMTAIMEGHEWIYVNGALTESSVHDIKKYVNSNANSIITNDEQLINVFEWVLNKKVGKK